MGLPWFNKCFVWLLWLLLQVADNQAKKKKEEFVELPTPAPEKPGDSIFNTIEFKAIIGGVAGFWGGGFALGTVYILLVLAKRFFKPEEDDVMTSRPQVLLKHKQNSHSSVTRKLFLNRNGDQFNVSLHPLSPIFYPK